jgi:hypothetical protein
VELFMKAKKAVLKYSIELDEKYAGLIRTAMKHLADTNYKSVGKPIFVVDVFRWALGLVAEKLDYSFDGMALEFVEASELPRKSIDPYERYLKRCESNKAFAIEESRLAKILSEDPSHPLWDYDENYKPKGISLQEFVKMKELDL